MNSIRVLLAKWKRSSFFLFALLALYIAMFLPFWRALLLGFIFASACAPMLNSLRKNLHTKRSRAAYVVVAISVLLLVGVVTVILVNLYSFIFNFFQDPQSLSGFFAKINRVQDQILLWADGKGLFPTPAAREKVIQSFAALTAQGQGFLLDGMQTFLRQSPQFLLSTFVFLLTFTGILVAGPKVWRLFARLFDLDSVHRDRFSEFEKVCARTIGSHLFIGMAQATIVVIGAMIARGASPFLLWVVTFCFSMIPLIGASSIPFFWSIFLFLGGNDGAGTILLLTSGASASAESLLRVWFFSKASQCNPIVSFISLMGGILLFGFVGLVIAPVVEQLVMTWILRDERGGEEEVPHRSRGRFPSPSLFDQTGGQT